MNNCWQYFNGNILADYVFMFSNWRRADYIFILADCIFMFSNILADYVFMFSNCRLAPCCECRQPVSGSSGGNLPVHDTQVGSFPLSRLRQWRDAALAADTQLLQQRGLVCNKMPFPTRPLQPSSLGRGALPPGEDPLQWMSNQNLCQAMRQLVSLLKQADSVFGDLEVRVERVMW